MRPRPSRPPRGVALVEVMIAGAVLLLAVLGFVAVSIYAVTATSVAHRRTTETFLRGELIDRLAVTPRSALATLAGYTSDPSSPQYVVDTCYDVEGRVLSRNTGYASQGYACGTGTVYRSHVAAAASGTATWNVGLYVDRADQACTPATRYQSVGCTAADLRLTD
jgi:Tfp pilus assembly protein PilV